MVETMIIRLDDVKKILKVLKEDIAFFGQLEPSIEENIEKYTITIMIIMYRLDSRIKLEVILDENFGLQTTEAAY